jgi:Tol biopolymer transport system component
MRVKAYPKTNASLLQLASVLLICGLIFVSQPFSLTAYSEKTISQAMVLAYSGHRDGKSAIYIIDIDNSEPQQITDGTAHDFGPAWSPDGNYIAFVSDRDSPSITTPRLNAYIIGIDGKGLRRITNNDFNNFSPSWSPDGKTLAFASTRQGNTQIYLIDVQTGIEHLLTTDNNDNTQPAWSPDGELIAFVSNRSGNYEIYTMKPDGSGISPLTGIPDSYSPAWSPDGDSIVFEEGNAFTGVKISIVQLDTKETQSLTSEGIYGRHPSWAANANLIAFTAVEDDKANIFVINMESSEIQRVTSDGGFDPAWKPE